MKKFQKVIALVAVSALVLTGCSSKKQETEKVTEKAVETQAAAETQAAVEEAAPETQAVIETEAAQAVIETEAEAVIETEAEAVIETEAEAAAEAMTEAEEAAAEVMTEAEEAAAEVMTEAEEAIEAIAAETEAEDAAAEAMTEAEEPFEEVPAETEEEDVIAEVLSGAEEIVNDLFAETEMDEATEQLTDLFGTYSDVKTVSEGKLIVGTEAGFAPYEYLVGDDVEGIDIDIAQAVANAIGVELEVQNMDFDGALLAVQQGKVDIVAAGVSVSEEREEVMDFSTKYVDSKDVIIVNSEDPQVEESSGEALEGKVVGVQQGNIADLWVSNPDNASPKSVQRYTKFAQAALDLGNGKIDCIVMDEAPALELVASNDGLEILDGDPLFEDSYAIAIKKGNDDMKDAVDAVIVTLLNSGMMDQIIATHSPE